MAHSQEERRFLIARTVYASTKSGRTVAELFSVDTRLQYPVLVLFDLSMLADVGIDVDDLRTKTEIHRRYLAYYQQSAKRNAEGNQYLDVDHLEPLPTAATPTTTPAITTAILDELRAIHTLLEALLARTPACSNEPPAASPPISPARAQEPEPTPAPVLDPPPPISPATEEPHSSLTARREFYRVASDAMARNAVPIALVNRLATGEANTDGWDRALATLQAHMRDEALPIQQHTRGRSKLFK